MTTNDTAPAAQPGYSVEYLFTLLKYTGISFIAGSINHGAFSELRSLVTAGIGITAFVVGALLERRAYARTHPDEARTSVWTTLAWGAVSSVGLGFFTGGLQHFPDSPDRSVWVVPVGFGLAAFALALKYRGQLFRRTTLVAMPALTVAVAAVVGGMFWFYTGPGATVGGHSHGETSQAAHHGQGDAPHNDTDHHDAAPQPAPTASAVARSRVVSPTTTAPSKRGAALKRRTAAPTPTVTVTRTVTAAHGH